MGEFEFIEALRANFADIGDGSITGIGDDCAVLPVAGAESIVLTTDMLTEEIHFLRHATSPRELGAKALAVNLSDVAAMGARPVASLLSLALPAECTGEWAHEFAEGYREMSQRFGVRLAGGDTTGSAAGVAINVVAIGRAPSDRLKYRSGARVGDIVAVNGPLGESAAGLRDILDGRPDTPLAAIHRSPVPQVHEGVWLGGCGQVHSMIDLSDGLASDLVHILRASGVAAEIELTAIPASSLTGRHEDPVELAVTGGEDYKLLFTSSPVGFARLAQEYRSHFGADLHPIGRITEGAPGIVWTQKGVPVTKNWRGFVHF